MNVNMTKTLTVCFLLLTALSASPAFASNWFCCIQSTKDNNEGIVHSGKSQYCVMNNSQEMHEVSDGVFEIAKYGYTFRIDVNAERLKSIAITKPDGRVQTAPEREILRGLMWDLFIGTFGLPAYQYSSETASGFRLDCTPK